MAASIKRIGELMRQVYRDFACGLTLGEDAPDAAAPYWSIASSFSGERPASPHAHALAFLHLLQEEGIEGCIYHFGIPDLFTHCGVIVESERGPVFFDAHTGEGFGEPLAAVLDKLGQGVAPKAEAPGKNRKVCVVNLEVDSAEAVGRLAATADRELVGLSNQRAFLVAWNARLYAECCENLSSALDVLVEAGGVRDFAGLLLCPLEVIDGKETYTDIAHMPVIGPWFAGRDGAGEAGASKTATSRRRGEQSKQLMQAARMASTNRIIEDLRRDLDQLRREGEAPRGAAARSYSPRTSAANLAEITELRAALEAAELMAQQADAAAKRFQAEHARVLDQSVLDHGLTQEALRKASDELRTERAQRLELDSEHLRSRHQAERLEQEVAAARRQLDEERTESAARAADLQRRLNEALAARDRLTEEHAQLSEVRDRLVQDRERIVQDRDRMGQEIERLRDRDGERSREFEQERNRWSENLEKANQQVERTERRLEQLQAAAEDGERDAAERDRRIAALTTELEAARSDRDTRLAVLTSELEAAHSERDARVEALELELETARSERDARIKALESERDARIDALELDRDARIQALESERDARVEALELDRDARVEALESELETARADRDDQVAALASELEKARSDRDVQIHALALELEAVRSDRDARIAASLLELDAARAEQAAAGRRQEEDRRLLQVAQSRLERELQAASSELVAREREVQTLARTIAKLAYSPAHGQPITAPDLNADARAQAALRAEQRIAELEHARAAAEAELENHRTMLANSRYVRTRKALMRLIGK